VEHHSLVPVVVMHPLRDWHGFEKPMGKCCGLDWGMGMGWVHPTLSKPVPAAMDWQVTTQIKTPLEMRSLASSLFFRLSLLPAIMLHGFRNMKKGK